VRISGKKSHVSPTWLFPKTGCDLAFHAHHLPQGVNDIDEILLRVHHGIDGFVGHWSLVKYFCIFTALHTSGGGDVIRHGKPALGLRTRHGSSCTMATATKAFRISLDAHDVGTHPHAAGNDSHIAFASAHRTLSNNQISSNVAVRYEIFHSGRPLDEASA